MLIAVEHGRIGGVVVVWHVDDVVFNESENRIDGQDD